MSWKSLSSSSLSTITGRVFYTGIQRHVQQGEIAESGATNLLRFSCFGDLKGFSPTKFVVMIEYVFQPLVYQRKIQAESIRCFCYKFPLHLR